MYNAPTAVCPPCRPTASAHVPIASDGAGGIAERAMDHNALGGFWLQQTIPWPCLRRRSTTMGASKALAASGSTGATRRDKGNIKDGN